MLGLTDGDRAELHAAARPWGSWSEERAHRILEATVETIVARHVAAALHPARPRRLCEVPQDASTAEDIDAAGWRHTFTPARRWSDPHPWSDFRAVEPGTRLPVRDRHGEHVADAVFGEIKMTGESDAMSGWIVHVREDDGD